MIIAIVDDGVRVTHNSIRDYIWNVPGEVPGNNRDDDGNGYIDDSIGWDLSDHDNQPTPPDFRDDFFHGTHLAGIVSSIASQVLGNQAAQYIKILPVKTLADEALQTGLRDGYAGVEYAAGLDADIILTAWGQGQIGPAERQVIEQAVANGAIVVAAAGNFQQEIEQYPAAIPGVLAAGSLGRNGALFADSTYGQFLDLLAPAEDIASASASSDSGSESHSGSSQAAAFVAVSAALVKLAHPDLSPERVRACLLDAAIPLGLESEFQSGKLGAGRLRLDAAIVCPLFSEPTPSLNLLPRSKGYLYKHGRSRESTTWVIRPEGSFSGFRFRPVIAESRAARGTLEFRSDEPGSAPVSYPLDQLPADIFVPGNQVNVAFLPEGRRQRFDWLMEYEAETINFSEQYCRGQIELSREGMLEDGSEAGPYMPRSDCRWLITAPEGQVIQFNFHELDTEANTDQLMFFHGNTTIPEFMLANYSGQQLPEQYRVLTSAMNQVLVWFVTDGRNQGQGWRFSYRFVENVSSSPQADESTDPPR